MSRPSLPARGAYGAVALLLAAPLLSACMAGQEAATSVARSVTTGVSGDIGDIGLRNVYLEPTQGGDQVQQGGDAALVATIVNNGTRVDELNGIDSQVATALSQSGNIQVPPAQVVSIAPPDVLSGAREVRLTGFTQSVRTGETVRLTFHFANAGDLDLQVPVESPSVTTATSTPIPTETPGEVGSPSPSGTPTEVPVSSTPSPSITIAPTGTATPTTGAATSGAVTPSPTAASASPSPIGTP